MRVTLIIRVTPRVSGLGFRASRPKGRCVSTKGFSVMGSM